MPRPSTPPVGQHEPVQALRVRQTRPFKMKALTFQVAEQLIGPHAAAYSVKMCSVAGSVLMMYRAKVTAATNSLRLRSSVLRNCG
jgi:hypothetical protein